MLIVSFVVFLVLGLNFRQHSCVYSFPMGLAFVWHSYFDFNAYMPLFGWKFFNRFLYRVIRCVGSCSASSRVSFCCPYKYQRTIYFLSFGISTLCIMQLATFSFGTVGLSFVAFLAFTTVHCCNWFLCISHVISVNLKNCCFLHLNWVCGKAINRDDVWNSVFDYWCDEQLNAENFIRARVSLQQFYLQWIANSFAAFDAVLASWGQ